MPNEFRPRSVSRSLWTRVTAHFVPATSTISGEDEGRETDERTSEPRSADEHAVSITRVIRHGRARLFFPECIPHQLHLGSTPFSSCSASLGTAEGDEGLRCPVRIPPLGSRGPGVFRGLTTSVALSVMRQAVPCPAEEGWHRPREHGW